MVAIGSVVGRWTVIGVKEVISSSSYKVIRGKKFLCRCSCGTEKLLWPYMLKNGFTMGCGGCRDKQLKQKRGELNPSYKHGMSSTQTYRIWSGIRSRCYDPNSSVYRWYGAKGIRMDPRWDSFEEFLKDMGPRPFVGAEIDRKDSDGAYALPNCRWVTKKENCKNKKTKPDEMMGKNFGEWKVLEKISPYGASHYIYLCSCSCGSKGRISGGDLRRGRSQTCRTCAYKRKKESLLK